MVLKDLNNKAENCGRLFSNKSNVLVLMVLQVF